MIRTSTISWWNPKETLPSDGADVLIFTKHNEILASRYRSGDWLDLTSDPEWYDSEDVIGWTYPNMVIHA